MNAWMNIVLASTDSDGSELTQLTIGWTAHTLSCGYQPQYTKRAIENKIALHACITRRFMIDKHYYLIGFQEVYKMSPTTGLFGLSITITHSTTGLTFFMNLRPFHYARRMVLVAAYIDVVKIAWCITGSCKKLAHVWCVKFTREWARYSLTVLHKIMSIVYY